MEQIYVPRQDYKVLCLCYTYNQSKYIEDTLNGFAIQKTNFPFVCLVIDDCSQDGEQEVIRAWMERECDMSKAELVDLEASHIIIVPHMTNPNCTFAVYLLKRNLFGKPLKQEMIAPWIDHCEYEALCEGDDYWIVEDKLQNQVVLLDSNREFSLCFTNAEILYEMNCKSDIRLDLIESRIYSPNEILKKWIVPTASMLFRTNINNVGIRGDERIVNGDIVYLLRACRCGMIFGLDYKTVRYRVQEGGVTYSESAKLSRYKRMPYHFEFIRDNFGDILETKFLDRKIAQCYIRLLPYASTRKEYVYLLYKVWYNSKLSLLKHFLKSLK